MKKAFNRVTVTLCGIFVAVLWCLPQTVVAQDTREPQFVIFKDILPSQVVRPLAKAAPAQQETFPATAVVLENVPAYSWSYGCGVTVGAMLFGYYDNIGYGDLYTGPANGGVCPMNNEEAWGTTTYAVAGNVTECPFAASHSGVEGRTTRGHVDDYWVDYGSSAPDPYITNGWLEHTPKDCIADFMGTNKDPDVDGTTFYYRYDEGDRFGYPPRYSSPGRETDWDFYGYTNGFGYGLFKFARYRGYSVNRVFNQMIQGYKGNTDGFTFEEYKAEIDAGRPVALLFSGHATLGFGYDDSNGQQKVYLRNTWDHSYEVIDWGGYLAAHIGGAIMFLPHIGVTVFEIGPPIIEPVILSESRHVIAPVGTFRTALSVTMAGPPPYNYEWFFYGLGDSGTSLGNNSPNILFSNPQRAQSGIYRVKVTNQRGTVWSGDLELHVLEPKADLAAAADLSGFTWYGGGIPGNPIAQSAVSFDGQDAIKLAPANERCSTEAAILVQNPGQISFTCKKTDANLEFYFIMYVNNTQESRVYELTNTDWETKTFDIPGSFYWVLWGIKHSGPLGATPPAAYVDQVSYKEMAVVNYEEFVDLVGDKDNFHGGDGADNPSLSDKAIRIIQQTMENPPVPLDTGGVDRPVGVTHRFPIIPTKPISAATLNLRFTGEQCLFNDLIFFEEPNYPIRIILLRDLLGYEPEPGQVYTVSVDLTRVPVRYLISPADWAVPCTSWPAWADVPDANKAILNLLPELNDGQFDLVFADDTTLDYSELILKYGATTVTPVGVQITAAPQNGMYVTFDIVNTVGRTTAVINNNSSVPLPAHYDTGSVPEFYAIQTSASVEGSITVRLHYVKERYANEDMLRLLHAESGHFVDRTVSIDTENHFITARVSSLSEFVVAEFMGMTEGKPKGTFGSGYQTDGVTEHGTWRWAEYFYGFKGIDQIAWMQDACGQWHNYLVGWHQDDLGEYLMKFGRDYSRLILRGLADYPGPVKVAVYIDGEYKATAEWNNNNNCNQDVAVDIPGIYYGTHAIAVKFVNDWYNPGPTWDPNRDRNMFLDGLYVAESPAFTSITGGQPKGTFGSGRQTDEVTEPGTWRWAPYFYGFQGIDQIAWMWDNCGANHNYLVGWHQNDLGEYLMKFGGSYDRLTLRGLADRPGPVQVQIYIDGQLKGATAFTNNNNCNQEVSVEIPGIAYGTHAIAVKFVNDYYNPGPTWDPDRDRNMFLEALRVSE